jgi:hypothetical protein
MQGLEQCSPDNLLTAKRTVELGESGLFSVSYAESQNKKLPKWKHFGSMSCQGYEGNSA